MIIHLDEDEREAIITLCSIGFQSCGKTLSENDLSYNEVEALLSLVCMYENLIKKLIEKEK